MDLAPMPPPPFLLRPKNTGRLARSHPHSTGRTSEHDVPGRHGLYLAKFLGSCKWHYIPTYSSLPPYIHAYVHRCMDT